jgi:formate dehydrogenase subunit beta
MPWPNLLESRTACRDQMFAETAAATDSVEKLGNYMANCVNCYNCRVACPVCYCKECVFVTDVFNHDPAQYLRWAQRKGAVKMPTDTVFYHLTRLTHMSTACVGCGQCSNACPNDIPVMELFRLVGHARKKRLPTKPAKASKKARRCRCSRKMNFRRWSACSIPGNNRDDEAFLKNTGRGQTAQDAVLG